MAKKGKIKKKRLVVVAGPSCSGKSWIIDQLKSTSPDAAARVVQKQCKLKGRVLSNRLRLYSLRKDIKKYLEARIQKRLRNGGYLHFDSTSARQALKRSILHDLIGEADEAILVNIVMGFDQWISANQLRMKEDVEHPVNSFVRKMLALHSRNPDAARRCYSFMFDEWQRFLESFPELKCFVFESRRLVFIKKIDREKLGLVNMTPLQLVWLRLRYGFLLARVSSAGALRC